MHSVSSSAPRRAFTLIELLVVVAIVAMLISILIPSMSRAREQTKAVVCQSSLRALGTAVHMYAQTNGDWFPEYGFTHGGGDAHAANSWIRSVAADYGEQEKILHCPTDRSPYWTTPINGKLRHTSYATNFYIACPGIDNPLYERDGHAYDRADWIKLPCSTIYFVELVETPVGDDDFTLADHVHPETWADLWPNDQKKAGQQVMLTRHLAQANYEFVDGHAERLPYNKTFSIRRMNQDVPEWDYNKYDPTIAR